MKQQFVTSIWDMAEWIQQFEIVEWLIINGLFIFLQKSSVIYGEMRTREPLGYGRCEA
jgi:hypothetical protein